MRVMNVAKLEELATNIWRTVAESILTADATSRKQQEEIDSAVADIISLENDLRRSVRECQLNSYAALSTQAQSFARESQAVLRGLDVLAVAVETARAGLALDSQYALRFSEGLEGHRTDISEKITAYSNALQDAAREWQRVSAEPPSEKIQRMRGDISSLLDKKAKVRSVAEANAEIKSREAVVAFSQDILNLGSARNPRIGLRAGLTGAAAILGMWIAWLIGSWMGIPGAFVSMGVLFSAIGAWYWLGVLNDSYNNYVADDIRNLREQAQFKREGRIEDIKRERDAFIPLEMRRLDDAIGRLQRELVDEEQNLSREQTRAQRGVVQKVDLASAVWKVRDHAFEALANDLPRKLRLDQAAQRRGASLVWRETLKSHMRTFDAECETFIARETVSNTLRLKVGSRDIPAPAELSQTLQGDLSLRIPLVANLMESCYIKRGPDATSAEVARRLASWYALEICARVGKSRVTIVDLAGLGSGYGELLSMGKKDDDVLLLASRREVDERLSELVRTAISRNRALAVSRSSDWLERRKENDTDPELAEVVLIDVPRAGLLPEQLAHIETLLGAGRSTGIVLVMLETKGHAQGLIFPEGICREIEISGSAAFQNGYLLHTPDSAALFRKAQTIAALLADRTPQSATRVSSPKAPSWTFAQFITTVVPKTLRWQSDLANTDENISIPIGVMDNGDVANLVFDDGAPHALLLGGTGSGKTNFLHTLIQAGCLKFSPDQLRLYLADLKSGVSFEPYARLDCLGSHFGAVACTSSVVFGAVLIDAAKQEMQRRYDSFKLVQRRQQGESIKGLAHYRKLASPSDEKLPRQLVIIDEFQALFDDAARRRQTLENLVTLLKQGRQVGVHVMLATQSLRGKAGDLDQALSQIHTRMILPAAMSDANSIFRSMSLAQQAVDYCSKPGKCFMSRDFGEKGGSGFTNPESKDNSFFFSTLEALTTDSPPPAHQVPIVWSDDVGSLRDNFQFRSMRGSKPAWYLGVPYSAEHALAVPLEKGVTTATVAVEDRSHARALIASLLMSLLQSFDGIDVFWLQHKKDGGPLRQRDFDSMTRDLGLTEVKYLDSMRALAAVLANPGDEQGKRPQVAIVPDVTTLDGKRSSSGSSWDGPLTGGDESDTSSDIDHLLSIASLSAESPRIVLLLASSYHDLLDGQLKSVNELVNIRITHGRQKGSRTREFLRVNDLPEMLEADLVLMTEKRSSPMTFRPFDEKWSI